jgi:hypothetical protein
MLLKAAPVRPPLRRACQPPSLLMFRLKLRYLHSIASTRLPRTQQVSYPLSRPSPTAPASCASIAGTSENTLSARTQQVSYIMSRSNPIAPASCASIWGITEKTVRRINSHLQRPAPIKDPLSSKPYLHSFNPLTLHRPSPSPMVCISRKLHSYQRETSSTKPD